MVAAKGKNQACLILISQRDPAVGLQSLLHVFSRHIPPQHQIEIDDVHILSIHSQCRGIQIQIQSQGSKQMKCVARLVRAKFAIVMFANCRRRQIFVFLADIAGPAHAHECATLQVVLLFRTQCNRVHQRGQVVRVAADYLKKFVLAGAQRLIVDAARIHFAETKLTSLGNETVSVVTVAQIELLLIFVTGRRAINHHRGSVDGFQRVVGRFHAHRGELCRCLRVDGQSRAFTLQREHFRFICQQGSALVEGHLRDA